MANQYDYLADASRATGIGPAPETAFQKFKRRGIAAFLDDETPTPTPVPSSGPVDPYPGMRPLGKSSNSSRIEDYAPPSDGLDVEPDSDADDMSDPRKKFASLGQDIPKEPPMVENNYANRLGYGDFDKGGAPVVEKSQADSMRILAPNAFQFSNTNFDSRAKPEFEWKDDPQYGHNFRMLTRTPGGPSTPYDVLEHEQGAREARDITTQNYINDLGLQSKSRMAEIEAQDPYAGLRMQAEARAYPERIKAMTELEKTNRELQSRESVAQLDAIVKQRVAQTEAAARREAAQYMGPGREMAKSSLERQSDLEHYNRIQHANAMAEAKRRDLEKQPDGPEKAAGLKQVIADHDRELSAIEHSFGRTRYSESQSTETFDNMDQK